jgi:hypothetical protein
MRVSKENADKCFILLAGVTGTFVLLMADLCTENPAIYKAGNLLSKHLSIGQHDDGSLSYGVLFIVLLMGLVICWIYEPKTKLDAFIRGMSIFALLSLAPPVDVKTSQPVNEASTQSPAKVSPVSSTDNYIRPSADMQEMKVWNAAFREPTAGYRWVSLLPQVATNATIIYNEWVSSTQPETGTMSFITNSINIQKLQYANAPVVLAKGTRVQVLATYDTPSRGYRYLHIKFYMYNQVWDGWIYSGKKPDYYINVALDR